MVAELASLPPEIAAAFRRELQDLQRAHQAMADACGRLAGGLELSEGEREACEVLFPAWHASPLGGQATTVAALFGAEPATDLGRFIAKLIDRAGGERAARQQLGLLLRKVEGVGVEGLVVRRLSSQSGSAVWDCSPL